MPHFSSCRGRCRFPFSYLLRWALPALVLLLSACVESSLPDGAVAEVNGRTISLRQVQALMDSRFVDMGSLEAPTPEGMKERYGEALGTLIIARLAEEELAERGQAVSGDAVSHEEQLIRDDYGDEDFTASLAREGLDYEDWRQLLHLHLTLRALERQVLLPGIRISVDEVRAYHAAHTDQFTLPDHMMLCFLSGDDRQELEAWCKRFPAGRDSTPDGLRVQCLDMREEELPPAERKEVAALAEGSCGKIREADGRFQAFGLVVRHKASVRSAAAVYPFIEAALRKRKLRDALAGWLENRLARADIRVTPALRPVLEDMARRSEERERQRRASGDAADARAAASAADDGAPEPSLPERRADARDGNDAQRERGGSE